MADLTDLQAAETVKIVGASTLGVESTPVSATTNGALHSNLRDNSGNEIGITTNPLIAKPEIAANTLIQKNFSATTTTALTVGTSETAAYLFRNPNGSGVTARIFRFYLNISGAVTYRFYHTPTITSTGTGLAEINQYIKTSPATAAVTVFQSPTASANGTLLWQYAASAQTTTRDADFTHQLIVDPNFDILVTAQAGANNTPITITFFWSEVA